MNLKDTLKTIGIEAIRGLEDIAASNTAGAHERICLIAQDCAAYLARYKHEGVILDAYGSACPDGYDTVIGWLAKNKPHIVELMSDPVHDTMADGRLLAKTCKDRGIEAVKVDAPLIFVKEGFHVINSYPIRLLEERFNV